MIDNLQTMTFHDLTKVLCLDADRVVYLLKTGALPYFGIGAEVRVLASDVQAYIRAGIEKRSRMTIANNLSDQRVWSDALAAYPEAAALVRGIESPEEGTFGEFLKLALDAQ